MHSPSANTCGVLNSPVRFTATATSDHPITGFVVYVNDQNVYLTNNSSLDAAVALPAGTYSVYIRAWDSTGAYETSSTFSITVSGPEHGRAGVRAVPDCGR